MFALIGAANGAIRSLLATLLILGRLAESHCSQLKLQAMLACNSSANMPKKWQILRAKNYGGKILFAGANSINRVTPIFGWR